MAEIIDLNSRRPKSTVSVPDPALDPVPEMYCVRIVRGEKFSGEILGHPDLLPHQQRLIAADLIDLSRAMIHAAYQVDGDQGHNLVGEYRVMASGRLTGWTSPQVDTEDKLEWLVGMVCDLVSTVPTNAGDF